MSAVSKGSILFMLAKSRMHRDGFLDAGRGLQATSYVQTSITLLMIG
jgi:hypothetical protein